MRRDFDRNVPRQQQAMGTAMSGGNSLYRTLAAARSVQPGNRHAPQIRTPEYPLPQWYRLSYGVMQALDYQRYAMHVTNPTWFDPDDHTHGWPLSAYAIGYNVFPYDCLSNPIVGDATTGSADIETRLALLDSTGAVLNSVDFQAAMAWDFSGDPRTQDWTTPAAPSGCAGWNDAHAAAGTVPTFNALAIMDLAGNLITDPADTRGPSYVYVIPYPRWAFCEWAFAETELDTEGVTSTGILWANPANHAEAYPQNILGWPTESPAYNRRAFRQSSQYELLWPCQDNHQSKPNPPPASSAHMRLQFYDGAANLIGWYPFPIPNLDGPLMPANLEFVPYGDYITGDYNPRVCGVEIVLVGDDYETAQATLSTRERWIFVNYASDA